jgi:hypothetical protein
VRNDLRQEAYRFVGLLPGRGDPCDRTAGINPGLSVVRGDAPTVVLRWAKYFAAHRNGLCISLEERSVSDVLLCMRALGVVVRRTEEF